MGSCQCSPEAPGDFNANPAKVHFLFQKKSWSSKGMATKMNLVVVSNIFYFPYLGKWSNLTNIFQMGGNHQLVKRSPGNLGNSVLLYLARDATWSLKPENFACQSYSFQRQKHIWRCVGIDPFSETHPVFLVWIYWAHCIPPTWRRWNAIPPGAQHVLPNVCGQGANVVSKDESTVRCKDVWFRCIKFLRICGAEVVGRDYELYIYIVLDCWGVLCWNKAMSKSRYSTWACACYTGGFLHPLVDCSQMTMIRACWKSTHPFLQYFSSCMTSNQGRFVVISIIVIIIIIIIMFFFCFLLLFSSSSSSSFCSSSTHPHPAPRHHQHSI